MDFVKLDPNDDLEWIEVEIDPLAHMAIVELAKKYSVSMNVMIATLARNGLANMMEKEKKV